MPNLCSPLMYSWILKIYILKEKTILSVSNTKQGVLQNMQCKSHVIYHSRNTAPFGTFSGRKCSMFLKQELLKEVCFHIMMETVETILQHRGRNKLCSANTFTKLTNK